MAIFSINNLRKPLAKKVPQQDDQLKRLAQQVAQKQPRQMAAAPSQAGRLPTGIQVGSLAGNLAGKPSAGLAGGIDPNFGKQDIAPPSGAGQLPGGIQVGERAQTIANIEDIRRNLGNIGPGVVKPAAPITPVSGPGDLVQPPTTQPPGPVVGEGVSEKPDIPFTQQQLIDAAIRRMLEGTPNDPAARAAMEGELRASEARALQSARARGGLAGFGLSGAQSALESDIGRTQARSRALALEEFDRQRRQESIAQQLGGIGAAQTGERLGFERDAFAIAMAQLENELQKDLNGDGVIGTIGTTPGTNQPSAGSGGANQSNSGAPPGTIVGFAQNQNPDEILANAAPGQRPGAKRNVQQGTVKHPTPDSQNLPLKTSRQNSSDMYTGTILGDDGIYYDTYRANDGTGQYAVMAYH